MGSEDPSQNPHVGGQSSTAAGPTSNTIFPRLYSMSRRGMILFAGLGAVLAVPSLTGIWYFTTSNGAPTVGGRLLAVLICFGLACLGGYSIASAFVCRLVLYEDAIESIELFGRRKMRRADIAGRKLQRTGSAPATLVLMPVRKGAKKLKIANVFQTDAFLNSWLESITDLDAIDAQAARQQNQKFEAAVAASPYFGATPIHRLSYLAKARKFAAALHLGSLALCFWAVVDPRPYGLLIGILATLPWLAACLVFATHGLFRIDERRNDPRPSLVLLTIVPPALLGLRALADVNLVSWRSSLLPAALITTALLCTYAAADSGLRRRIGALALLAVFTAAYGDAAAVLGDVLFDRSLPSLFEAKVVAKHVSSGRTRQWYLKLAAWGPMPDAEDVKVSPALYAAFARGETACIRLHDGAFDFGWFEVVKCQSTVNPGDKGADSQFAGSCESQATGACQARRQKSRGTVCSLEAELRAIAQLT